MKRKLFAILMTLTLVLTYMPAMVFAAEGEGDTGSVTAQAAEEQALAQSRMAGETEYQTITHTAKAAAAVKPVSVTYTSEELPDGYIGTTWGRPEVKGAEFTVSFSDDTTKTYKYLDEYYDEATDDWMPSGFYLNGDRSKPLREEDEDDDIYVGIQTEIPIQEGENAAEFYYQQELDDENYYVSCPITVVGYKNEDIISVTYTQNSTVTGTPDYYDKMFRYDDGYSMYEQMVGDVITVKEYEETYDWDPETEEETVTRTPVEKTYVCEKYTETYDNGETSTDYAFRRQETDEEGQVEYMHLYPDFADDQIPGEWTWLGKSEGKANIYVDGVKAAETMTVQLPNIKVMTKAELVLADGFEPKVSIGQNDEVFADAFYGEGNKLVVTYSDGSTKEISYQNDRRYGFIDPTNNEDVWFYSDLKRAGITLQKDVPTELTFRYYEENGEDQSDEIEFKCTVTAKKTAVYAVSRTYQYTGKVIKPAVSVRTVYGNKAIPKSAYSFKYSKTKAVGSYGLPITIKDDNYFSESSLDSNIVWLDYTIQPIRPTISKATPAKKAAKVTWKKFSKANQKTITGFIVEYSLKKNFSSGVKTKYAKKTASSLTIKGLKSKKTYYVRVYSYKKIKYTYYDENNKKHTGSYMVVSKPSKVKKVKAK